jgi:DNA gyrase subunit A
MFYYADDAEDLPEEDDTPDYPAHFFLSREGYFKKITPQSLRMSGEQKVKEGDCITQQLLGTNRTELLFFTDQCQVYKTRASAFEDGKASLLGDFIPVKLGFDEGERVCGMICTTDYSGKLLFVFENGKAAKIPLSAYATKTNRKKLTAAFSNKSPLVKLFFLPDETDLLLRSSGNRALLVNSAEIPEKSTRSTQGVQVMTLRSKQTVTSVELPDEERCKDLQTFRSKNIPAVGKLAKDLEDANQIPLV